jgi:hypothetical protein
MPVTEVELRSTSGTDTQASFDLDTIGIEFEYPIARSAERAPATYAERSRSFDNDYPPGSDEWTLDENEADIPTGYVGSDHVGAEVTSAQLDLHTTQPEVWHYRTIQKAAELGYPFAATGYGDTVFGQHLHLSSLPRRKAEALFDMSQQDWFRVFVCTSLSPTSLDPWRHGGVTSGDITDGDFAGGRQSVVVACAHGEPDHYEWRLPEPMLPEHFGMVMHFLRLLETDGVEEARSYARDAVWDADNRLTAVQQYRLYDGRDAWSGREQESDNQTDPSAARFVAELMSHGE